MPTRTVKSKVATYRGDPTEVTKVLEAETVSTVDTPPSPVGSVTIQRDRFQRMTRKGTPDRVLVDVDVASNPGSFHRVPGGSLIEAYRRICSACGTVTFFTDHKTGTGLNAAEVKAWRDRMYTCQVCGVTGDAVKVELDHDSFVRQQTNFIDPPLTPQKP